MLEVPENVNFSWHFAEVYVECDEAAEDRRKMRLGEVIDDIRR